MDKTDFCQAHSLIRCTASWTPMTVCSTPRYKQRQAINFFKPQLSRKTSTPTKNEYIATRHGVGALNHTENQTHHT